MFKYEIFIISKIKKFNVPHHLLEDYLQECKTEVYISIKKYNPMYGKTLCRYLEMIVERKIIRMLQKDDLYKNRTIKIEEFDLFKSRENVEEKAIYEREILRIKNEQIPVEKQNVLQEIIFEGATIKEYSEKHNLTRKDVYNELYGLRVLLRKKM